MKALKLSKSKANGVSNDSYSSPEPTFKASFEDLRRPDGRQSLRQHFTGAFPETQPRPHTESGAAHEMGIRERLSRSNSGLTVDQTPVGKSPSSSSVDSVELKRLSTVRESNNAAIDIEQAISLLQELKKTASPQDLVALHKALLPTRDSVMLSPGLPPPTQDDHSPASASSYVRYRSMMPPGIATRGGASGDPLRTQEEAQTSVKLKKARSKAEPTPKNSIAALDLADETVQKRAATPLTDETMHMGAYRPGTLRITNGVASPEPSIRLGRTGHRGLDESKSQDNFRTAPSSPEGRRAEMRRSESDDAYSSPLDGKNQPAQQEVFQEQYSSSSPQESGPQLTTRPRGRSFSNIPVPLDKDESQPRMYRPTRSRDPSKSPDHSRKSSAGLTSHSRKQSLSQLPLPIEDATGKQKMPMDRQVSAQSLQVVSRQSYEPIRPEIDDGKVSPLAVDTQQVPDMPRFAQRWSHRLSRISQASHENGSDFQLPINPQEDDIALRNLAKRLSAHSNLTSRETREAALAKLNGDHDRRQSEQTIDIRTNGIDGTPTPSPAAHGDQSAWPNVQKIDSGYGSDVSAQTLQRTMETEVAQHNGQNRVVEKSTKRVDQIRKINPHDNDGESQYSVDHLLNVPYLLPGSVMPSPPSARGSKKHLSLLGLTKTKKRRSEPMAIPNADEASPSAASSNPNTPSVASPKVESVESSPADQKTTRSKKKLQKPMPESVRKELRSQMKKMEETGSNNPSGIPQVSDTMASNFATRTQTAQSTEESSSFRGIEEVHAIVPVELNGESAAVEVPAATPSRKRSRSRGDRRPRSRTTNADSENSTSVQRSWSMRRMRSNSRKRSGSVTPKASANDLSATNAENAPFDGLAQIQSGRDLRDVSDRDPVISAPFDQSANLFRRTIAVPNAFQQQSQSQFENRPNFSRSKSGGLTGMEAGMASELARLKSRDMAIQNNQVVFEKSYHATPKSHRAQKSRDQTCWGASPGGQNPSLFNKPKHPLLGTEGAELNSRPHSPYAESIPSLPDIPTNVGAKVSRFEDMASQREINVRPSSATNANGDIERSGYSTESVADAVKRAVDARKAHGESLTQKTEQVRPAGPRKSKSKKQLRESRSRDLQRSHSEDPTMIGSTPVFNRSEQSQESPKPSDGQVNWDQHAKLWRERRKSIGETLGRPLPEDIGVNANPRPQSSRSPAIVVSPDSNPFDFDLGPRSAIHRRTDSASQHADVYRELIGENGPVKEDTGRVESTASFMTARSRVYERQSTDGEYFVDNAYSAKPYQSPKPQIERARSPGGRVRTPSGNFHPYTPANAVKAEQSRAESLAKLTGTTNSRPTSSAELPRSPSQQPSNKLDSLYDRYGGGFQYGYERGVGVGGSAGTRASKDSAHRKGTYLSETAGVDLSDIPIFLQRVQK